MSDMDATENVSEAESENRWVGMIERALTIDSRHFDRLFAILLLLFVVTLLAMTPQYRDDTQLFPLAIGIPTFVLLALLLVFLVSERASSMIEDYTTTDIFDLDDKLDDLDADSDEGADEEGLLAERKRVTIISLWTLALFGLILLVGFLPATFVFMLAFYRYQADQTWQRSFIYTFVTWAFIVVIFDVVLNTPFYEGVLEVSVPLPF